MTGRYIALVMPPFRTIAHLSDLHFGASSTHFAAAAALRDAVESMVIDHVIVTGDVTERGTNAEFAQFKELFGQLQASGRLVVVPGNHDRLGDDVARNMMGVRVDTVRGDGLLIIRVDSTGSHNRWLMASHGNIDLPVIALVQDALATALPGDFVVMTIHHHLLPLPEDTVFEKIANFFRLPFAAELRLGRVLLERLAGRCDLVLHGHRHAPKEEMIAHGDRDLRIYNAGSSTALGRFRLFSYDAGRLAREPEWIEAA